MGLPCDIGDGSPLQTAVCYNETTERQLAVAGAGTGSTRLQQSMKGLKGVGLFSRFKMVARPTRSVAGGSRSVPGKILGSSAVLAVLFLSGCGGANKTDTEAPSTGPASATPKPVAPTPKLPLASLSSSGSGTTDASAPPAGGSAVPSFKTLAAGATPAPFSLEGVKGGKVSLASYKGKVVLLDFWATWCVPCRKELPDYEVLYKTYGDQGLVVLGMVEPPKSGVPEMVAQQGLTFPNVYADQATVSAYGATAPPYAVLIDRQGHILKQILGLPVGGSLEFWTPLVERALKAGSSPRAAAPASPQRVKP